MNSSYQFLKELFLRTPYYSFNSYKPEHLGEVLQDNAFRNALFLASPVFYNIIATKGFEESALSDKEKLTLLKYYNRMCFRPTPFGCFSSFSLTTWGEGTTLKLDEEEDAILHLLPDQDLLIKSLLNNGSDATCILALNPGLYRAAGEYRYFKSIPDSAGHQQFTVDALPMESFHFAMFDWIRVGKHTLEEAAQWLVAETGCGKEQAADYLRFLLEEQILFDWTAGSIIEEKFKLMPVDSLHATGRFWNKWNLVPFSDTLSLSEAALEFQKLAPGIATADTQLFYAALERPARSTALGKAEQDELMSAVQALIALSLPSPSVKLKEFIAAFEAKFDRQRIPLLQAIDPDIGVPYGKEVSGNSGVLTGINFPEKQVEDTLIEWTGIHRLLFRLMGAAQINGRFACMEITKDDLSGLTVPDPGMMPPTLAVMFRKTGEHLVIDHAGGAAGNAIIGRFSAFSPEVLKLCRKIALAENAAHPGLIFAEIGQLSDTHADNINRRKRIYPFELPINVYSDAASDKQLLPEDLLVSVRNGELILESISKSKRVMPRLPTAYNYLNNQLALFQLLCDLQYQGMQTRLHFDLEKFFPGISFYPRVVFGNTILAPAKWRFEDKELLSLLDGANNDTMDRIRSFRSKYHLPPRISMGVLDQQLVFDLRNLKEAVFFLSCLKGNKNVLLFEYLTSGTHVRSGNKPMASQFIAFLAHEQKVYREIKKEASLIAKGKERFFMLGSNWLYLKLYCTPRAANEVLNKIVEPLIGSDRSKVSKWFFIRYQDPDYHLRVRLNIAGEQTGRLLEALSGIVAQPENRGLIKNYVGDSYQREIERYGEDIMEEVEELFYSGSLLVKRHIELRHKKESVPNNSQLGMLVMKRMITSFFDELGGSIAFTDSVIASFSKEFGVDKKLRVALDTKYREINTELTPYLSNIYASKGLIFYIVDLMSLTAGIFRKIADRTDDEKKWLLADLIHMQMNRVFEFEQRRQEYMCYYFLNKYFISMKERSKRGVK